MQANRKFVVLLVVVLQRGRFVRHLIRDPSGDGWRGLVAHLLRFVGKDHRSWVGARDELAPFLLRVVVEVWDLQARRALRSAVIGICRSIIR